MGNLGEVQKNFGKRASNYRNSNAHGNQSDLDRMISLLKPSANSIALDVATGGGHTAIKLAAFSKKVIAIDITDEMLKEASDYATEMGISNIDFRKEDIHKLNFQDCLFDIVTSRLAPHHFHNIRLALDEICRVLKPGGKFYIYDCSVIDGDEPEKVLNRIEFLRDYSHICSYSKRQWEELLSQIPIQIQEIKLHKDIYTLPEWFVRMEVSETKQKEIFSELNKLTEGYKPYYPYSRDYITTYRIEILGGKL